MEFKHILIILFLLSITHTGFSQQKSAVRFLKRADKKHQKLQSVSYHATYIYKGPTDKNNLQYQGNLKYSINPRDVFFGYDLWFENENYFTAYFSLGKSYRLIHQDKKIYPKRFLDPKKTNKAQGPFNEGLADNLFDNYFRNKNFINQLLLDKSLIFSKEKSHLCADTIHIIAKSLATNTNLFHDTLRNYKIDFFFDRKTKLPLKIIRSGISNKGDYFSEISFFYQAINQDSIHDFFIGYQLPEEYNMVITDLKKKHLEKKYTKKIPAPLFLLKDAHGNTINLQDYKGKVVLLDFWYSSCAPCIKASHYLEEFSKEYMDSNLVVLGMNPIDGANKINQHNKKWNVSYSGVLCSQEIKNKYNINSYPTFILIDKQGNIVFRSSGFSASLMHNIENQIQAAIRK